VSDWQEGRDVAIVASIMFVERELLTEGNDSMQRRWSKALGYSLILGVVLCSSLSLSGCGVFDFLSDLFSSSNGNEAQAEQEGDITTFVIRPGSLQFAGINTTLALDTHIVVQDQVTIYKGFEANVTFLTADGGNDGRTLDADHILIERQIATATTLTWVH
jgi:hypothetical protein